MLLGFASGYKGYRVLNIETMEIKTVANLSKIDETIFPAKQAATLAFSAPFHVTDNLMDNIREDPQELTNNRKFSTIARSNQTYTDYPADSKHRQSPRLIDKKRAGASINDQAPAPKRQAAPSLPAIMLSHLIASNPFNDQGLIKLLQDTRSLAKDKSDREVDLEETYLLLADIAQSDSSYTPKNYKQAQLCPQADKWVASHKKEADSLIGKGTFEFTDSIPPGTKPLRTKAVYKIKEGRNETIYKTRITAIGTSQKYGIDYTETFAPTISWPAIRLMLSLFASRMMHIHHVDINTAFLNGELDEIIYIFTPDGVPTPNGERYARLLRALYGLKQAGRQWVLLLCEKLKGFKLIQETGHLCLFYKDTPEGPVYIFFYVDDIVVASESLKVVQDTKSYILSTFEGKDLGPITRIIGINVDYDQPKGLLSLQASHYIDASLARFALSELHPRSTPMDADYLAKLETPEFINSPAADVTMFLQLIGTLIYMSVTTRPDISTAVSILARHSQNPKLIHLQSVIRVFQYLIGTKDFALKLGTAPDQGLISFCDSDYANSPHVDQKKSRTGYCIFYKGGLITWYSKLQSITTDSTSYAEYIAFYDDTIGVEILRQTLAGINKAEEFPTLAFNDNFSAERILRKEQPSGNHRHFDYKYHYSKSRIGNSVLPIHITSASNISDHFTKPLSKNEFIKHRSSLSDPSSIDMADLIKQGLSFRKHITPEYLHLQE